MNILTDENIAKLTIRTLRSMGHDVLDVKRMGWGKSDAEIWRIASWQRRLIITRDSDYKAFCYASHNGVLYLELHNPTPEQLTSLVLRVLAEVAEAEWPDLLYVVKAEADVRWRVSDNLPLP